MLELKLFGPGQARYEDQPLPGFPSQQPCRLLCYLILNRHQPLPREHLAAILWGRYPTQVSLKHLRNALWRLRTHLRSIGAVPDEYVEVQDGSVGFSPVGGYSLDVEVLEAAVTRYQNLPGRELAPEQAARVEEAVALYTGDLLTGIYEDWCLCERERLNLLYLNALSKLMSFHQTNRTYERGLEYGQRILAFDDTREMAHRQMMQLYGLLGDRNAALAQYERCAQILRETLQAAPMQATQRLYEQILHDQFPEDPRAPSQTMRSGTGGCDESTQLLLEQAHRSVQRLQTTLEQAAVELQRISRVVNALQPRAEDATPPLRGRPRDAA
jgi:DNA-binding SARP family transcriptional activator